MEHTVPLEESEGLSLPAEEEPTLSQQSQNPLWMLYVDGSSNAGGSGAGLVITGPDNFITEYALRIDFKASNNEAEYEALITGIALATELQVSRIRVHNDSQLVVSQVNGFGEVKEEQMIKYLENVRKEISAFEEFQIVQVPRTLNTRADALSKMASSAMFEPGNIYTETLPQPSVEREEVLQLSEEPSWMDPIIQYLKDGIVPSDRKEARRLVAKAAHYILDGQKLFGIPRVLVTDNGTQFASRRFKDFCGKLGIDQRFTLVGHPQANGQVEVTNQTLLQGLKKRTENARGLWAEELPNLLWAYRTTPRTATGESSFSLAFGVDTVIPVEIGAHSLRLEAYNERTNPNYLWSSLDLVEETREKARVRMAAYQHRVARYYNSNMKERSVRAGD
ncbi:uncharacterized protein LOC143890728 [Tasmannia lanceolata]|uniref:uncharacterized protein LOC143890728 n=1 Tax=Tasmannia lanceolata TaxID=3420 RepID=UPI00406486B1